MIRCARQLWLTFACLLPCVTFAQLTITSPVSRMVFQRNLQNEAVVVVTGLSSASATTIEGRFVPLVAGQGTPTTWAKLPLLPSSTAFQGRIKASAGWYRLEVRAKKGAAIITQQEVNRVGIGEVFVVAGQSNALGGFEPVDGAADDRVSCVDFREDHALDEQMFPLQFSHVSGGTNVGPSNPPYIWGPLGDKLVTRLNVPVLFLGAAQGGTSSTDWRQSAEAVNDPSSGQPTPYRRLGVALLHYVARTGMRAVLWHQGESDNLNSIATQQYVDNVRFIIDKSRQQTGFAQLSWLVSRASYINNQTNSNVIAAQNRLIAEVPGVYPGPSTDDLIGSDNRRPDGVHFGGAGLGRLTDRWEQSLTNDFFARAQPFTPSDSTALITTGYTLPLKRRPGEIIQVPSLRNSPAETGNTYKVQLLRAVDSSVVTESAPGIQNPLSLTLPGTLTNGNYYLRTVATCPLWTGRIGEPFTVDASAPVTSNQSIMLQPVYAGTADPSIIRIGYRYESGSHGYYIMVNATGPVDVRMERIDGGPFSDTAWNPAPPRSQSSADYPDFIDYNYIRNYPPVAFAQGGVEPGRYRLSVRPSGTTGNGYSIETTLLDNRQTLYIGSETTAPIPPVIELTGLSSTTLCAGKPISVSVAVSDGVMGSGNVFAVLLSDATGSFTSATTLGTGVSSPISATLPTGLSTTGSYRIKVTGSNPVVGSTLSDLLTVCPDTADLSLAMQVSNRIPDIGQAVSYTLALTNNGPQPANGVTIKSILPSGLTFVDAPTTSISAANGVLTLNAGTVNIGTTNYYSFRAKPMQGGTFATAAQITASNQFDPDSKPNSGTGDGQDDEVQVDLRTCDANGPFISSPNPNQTPLPTVQANQPPINPGKADLRLAVVSSNLSPLVSATISLSLTVSNRGGSSASNITAGS